MPLGQHTAEPAATSPSAKHAATTLNEFLGKDAQIAINHDCARPSTDQYTKADATLPRVRSATTTTLRTNTFSFFSLVLTLLSVARGLHVPPQRFHRDGASDGVPAAKAGRGGEAQVPGNLGPGE